MSVIRTAIADDEPLARERIASMLQAHDNYEIVAQCKDGAEAVAAIRKDRLDLVFLDVRMPELDGFQVLEALGGGPTPAIIFVTAFEDYALRAFEVSALDYLLKPFDRERFRAAMERAKRQIRRDNGGALDERIIALLEQMRGQQRYSERLVVKTGGRVFFLNTDEIDWIEAEGNYVSIHTGKKAYLLRETISSLEAQLDPKDFVRIHRSAIANINRIKELQPWSHGEYHVILHDGTQLTLSRSYRDNLQSALGNSL